jgi:hypothetical protein
MPCIALPVKFDDELPISVPEKKAILQKKGGQKYTFSKKFQFLKHFNSRHSQNGQGTLFEKVTFFCISFFSWMG